MRQQPIKAFKSKIGLDVLDKNYVLQLKKIIKANKIFYKNILHEKCL